MDNTDLKQRLGFMTDMVYALSEQFDVIREAAYDAVNEGTDNPEAILMRIKALAHIGGLASEDLQEWLNDLSLNLASGGGGA